MTVRAILLPAFLATAAAVVEGVPTRLSTITVGKGAGKIEYLTADKGRLVFGPPCPFGDGGQDEKETPDRWYVSGDKIKSSVGGGYLAYDVTGKDDTVFLTPKPGGEGTGWVVRRPPKGKRKNESHSIDEEWGLIQAASGPMKGWYLDVEEFEERRDGAKQTVTGRRMVLRKTSSWNVEAGRIYTHK